MLIRSIYAKEYDEDYAQWLKDNKDEFVYPKETYNQMKGGQTT